MLTFAAQLPKEYKMRLWEKLFAQEPLGGNYFKSGLDISGFHINSFCFAGLA